MNTTTPAPRMALAVALALSLAGCATAPPVADVGRPPADIARELVAALELAPAVLEVTAAAPALSPADSVTVAAFYALGDTVRLEAMQEHTSDSHKLQLYDTVGLISRVTYLAHHWLGQGLYISKEYPRALVRYSWRPPTWGSPVERYFLEHETNFSGIWEPAGATCDTFHMGAVAYADTHRVRVYGVDADGDRGPVSEPSLPYCPENDIDGTVEVIDGAPVDLDPVFIDPKEK